jgi:hypothetical protein
MKCPKCGEKWRVANTASNGDSTRVYLRSLATDILSWYSDDFVVRQRYCNTCQYSSLTIELEKKDILEIVNIVNKEGLPKEMEQKPKDKGKKS